MEQKFKDLGLFVVWSDAKDRQPIDFSIADEDDNIAWVWGANPNDVDWECNHPYEFIEFGDDREEQGECLLCGSYCDWHGVADENGYTTPEPHEWYPRRDVGGLIGEYLEELKNERAV